MFIVYWTIIGFKDRKIEQNVTKGIVTQNIFNVEILEEFSIVIVISTEDATSVAIKVMSQV